MGYCGPMGFPAQIPVHRVGGMNFLWLLRGYGFIEVWIMRGSTVFSFWGLFLLDLLASVAEVESIWMAVSFRIWGGSLESAGILVAIVCCGG